MDREKLVTAVRSLLADVDEDCGDEACPECAYYRPLRAALASESKSEWRDIASVRPPKDGSRFLGQIEGVDRPVMMQWNGAEWMTVDGNDWSERSVLRWHPLPPLPSAPAPETSND